MRDAPAKLATLGVSNDRLMMNRCVEGYGCAKNNQLDRDGGRPTRELGECWRWSGIEQGNE